MTHTNPMIAELIAIAIDPHASDELRTKAVTYAYGIGLAEGRYEGIAHACKEIGKPALRVVS